MFYKFSRFLCMVFVRIFFRFKIRGRENFYKVKGAVFAVNHSSFLDPILAGVASTRPVYYLARKSLFRNRFFGALLFNVNVIPFNREAPDTKSLKTAIQLMQDGQIVLVFPEGTRSGDGNLQPPHLGIGFIALKAKVPIIPAYIKGSHKILPRGKKFFRIAKADIKVGEPIYLDTWLKKAKIEKSDYAEVAELVMNRIKNLAGLYD